MWFDPYAKLAEIAVRPPATSATTATTAKFAPALVANVASVATPHALKPETEIADCPPYGITFGTRPRTWTGRVVSLDEWRRLTEWERHGPNGRHWSGFTKKWIGRKEA